MPDLYRKQREFSAIFGHSFALLTLEEEHHGHEGFWHVLMQKKEAQE